MFIVEHGVDDRTGEKLTADLAIFHAQNDSDLPGSKVIVVLAPAVDHSDRPLVTLLCLKHLDVRTFPTGALACPGPAADYAQRAAAPHAVRC